MDVGKVKFRPLKWYFEPLSYGFAPTDDPWTFENYMYNEKGAKLVAEKTTIGTWLLKHVSPSNNCDEYSIIYHGCIPTQEFFLEIIMNTELGELLING